MQFEYATVLTGSIGTGKSSTSAIFGELGMHIIDADSIAHQILDEQSSQIVALFGEQYAHDGIVDRVALGSLVFTDTKQRSRLEALLHPLIRTEIENQSKERDKLKYPYLIDIPLFFESASYEIESIIVVYTPREIQLTRLMERNSYSRAEALARIESQIDIEQKRHKATYLIDNSGDFQHLREQCRRVYREILEKYRV